MVPLMETPHASMIWIGSRGRNLRIAGRMPQGISQSRTLIGGTPLFRP